MSRMLTNVPVPALQVVSRFDGSAAAAQLDEEIRAAVVGTAGTAAGKCLSPNSVASCGHSLLRCYLVNIFKLPIL